MKPLVYALVLPVVALGFLPSVAAAQTYALRPNVAEGTTATFDQVVKDTSESRQPDSAGDAVTVTSSSNEHLFGHFKITGQVAGSPTAMRITFNSDCAIEETETDAPANKEKSPLAGRTLNLAMDANHTYTDDYKGDIDDDTRDELHEFLLPDADLFPDHPVRIGDFWDTSAKSAADTPLKKGESMRQWCRLDSVKQVNGRSIAHLTISYASVTHEDATSLRILQASGTALVDLDRGAVTDVTLTGTYTVRDAPPDKADKADPADASPADIASGDISGTYDQHVTVTFTDPPASQPAR